MVTSFADVVPDDREISNDSETTDLVPDRTTSENLTGGLGHGDGRRTYRCHRKTRGVGEGRTTARRKEWVVDSTKMMRDEVREAPRGDDRLF